MDYEYLEDLAGELGIDGDALQQVIDQLHIKTLRMAAPPYGVELSTAMARRDADRLRTHFAVQTGTGARKLPSAGCAGAACRRLSSR